ncbi:MAG: CAF17-like 4Fe-4S cluster assembly/insertion protein YgfZ [Methylobacter sp.]
MFPSPEHESERHIYPIAHLGILAVTGADAAKFLQGQITCNINDVIDTKSSLGAMCNPKGRAITTFLLVRNGDGFLMILPQELLAQVKKRLQMYVLRSNVTLTDSSDELCLIGLSDGRSELSAALNFATSRQEHIVVDFQNRSLIIAEAGKAQAFWQQQVEQGFQPASSAQWCYLDMISGIPWLGVDTSEEFIPQMLNLDKLGGISFNKGCYTGQEIVARTHYLGKAKREMFLAECDALAAPEPNSTLIDDSAGTEQSAGKVLYAQQWQNSCKMLVVLHVSETNTYNLKLNNDRQDKVTLLNRQ